MLELFQAVLLGIVQGLTEFLPVSSSGHLLLEQYFLGLNQQRFELSFAVALHLGTLVAVVTFFWRDLLRMAHAFVRSLRRGRNTADPDQRLACLMVASTIPAALIGFFLEDFFEAVRNPWVVVVDLMLVGILFIVGEAVGSRSRLLLRTSASWGRCHRARTGGGARPGGLTFGATIAVGRFLGLRREEAARFSFLMSCFSSESRKTLTRAALLWYFGAIMYSAVSEFRRFTREGRARSGCVAALLLS